MSYVQGSDVCVARAQHEGEPDLTPPPLHTSKQPDTVFVRYVLNSDVTHDRIESHPVIE